MGAWIDRVNEPDHIVIDGVNHQAVEAGARQGEKKFCILVKEQEGVADMRCIVEAVCSEGTAAFLQIALDNLMQIIIQGICLGLEIVVDNMDILSLTANLLDNAIEAAQRVTEKEKKVKIILNQSKGYLMFDVWNYYNKIYGEFRLSL